MPCIDTEYQVLSAGVLPGAILKSGYRILLKPNWDIQIPLVDGFGYGKMHSDFCYVASVNPSLPSSMTYPDGR